MTRMCQITGKKPMSGNRRSRAMNAVGRWFLPNVHFRRFWSVDKKRFFVLRVSAKGVRLIDKLGIDYYISYINKK